MIIDLSNNIMPYMGISRDSLVDFPEAGLTFQIVIYGAYDAGIIGPEGNGIAIFDRTRRYVVLDEHCKQTSGYFGPSRAQLEEFNRIMGLNWEGFRTFVNNHNRSRWMYSPSGKATEIM